MRFHVLPPPHTITRKDYSACPFTQNVLNWCKMMYAQGHVIYHYGHVDSVVDCTEHISVTDDKVFDIAYPGRDWKKNVFTHDSNDHAHKTYNERTIPELGKRKKHGDFIIAFWGWPQKPISDAHSDLVTVEPAVGTHNKPFTNHAIFASYAAMHYIYGKHDVSPRWYDAVIPHYFDTKDFDFNNKPHDYFLFMGRVIGDKGVAIAIEMTKRMGVKLLVVGQGDLKWVTNSVHDHVTHIPAVGPKERCEIMRNAKALIAPTYYAEPFGMVVVEAMMCGTPVLTSDWGAFAETNLHGITGYRCRNVEQFVWAGRNIDKIRRQACRDWAVNNYSLERVGPMYQEYFVGLEKVFNGGGGFFCEYNDRKDLDWLNRNYPTSS